MSIKKRITLWTTLLTGVLLVVGTSIMIPTVSASVDAGGPLKGCDQAAPGPGGPYDSTCDGSPSGNGNGGGNAGGKPCAGCVGSADDKNPPGQLPGPQDNNNGYECDGNSGIAKGNPAHSGCAATTTTIASTTTTLGSTTTTLGSTTTTLGSTTTTLGSTTTTIPPSTTTLPEETTTTLPEETTTTLAELPTTTTFNDTVLPGVYFNDANPDNPKDPVVEAASQNALPFTGSDVRSWLMLAGILMSLGSFALLATATPESLRGSRRS
jgi:hypothetical protein